MTEACNYEQLKQVKVPFMKGCALHLHWTHILFLQELQGENNQSNVTSFLTKWFLNTRLIVCVPQSKTTRSDIKVGQVAEDYF